MKVLYVDHAPVMGGAELVLLDLIRCLDRQRYHPTVATAPHSALLPSLATEGIESATMPFEQFNLRHPAFLFRLARSTLALIKIVRRQQPDVLHSNTVRAHIVSSLAARFTGVPLLWTIHDRTFPLTLARLLGPIPHRVIFVSRFLADLYAPARVDRQRCRIIVNGVRLTSPLDQMAARRTLSLPAQGTIVLNVGRFVEGKGQDVFLQAASLVERHRPDTLFLLIGSTNPADAASASYAKRLSELARSLGLEGKAIATGHQPDLAPYYAAADLCTYTAVAPEGFGLVIIEAMAHGKAVVASNLGAVPELVVDGVTGRLVRPRDAKALAEAILTLLEDREALHRFGVASRQRVAEAFDSKETFRQVQAVYEEMVAEARPGGRLPAAAWGF